jgi:chromate transporter
VTAGTPPGLGTAAPAGTAEPAAGTPGFAAVLRYFLRLDTSGFGGPIAVVGYMQRDLVQQRGQTMPGPLAAQRDPRAPQDITAADLVI